MMMTSKARYAIDERDAIMNTKEIASMLDTDAKTFRRFMRSHLRSIGADTAGKGGRYVIDASTPDDVAAIKASFEAWRKGSKVTIVRFD